MTVRAFRLTVKAGSFIDYDGHGYPVRNKKSAKLIIQPSTVSKIPDDATHIIWYNR